MIPCQQCIRLLVVTLDQLVSLTHQYCRFKELCDFSVADKVLTSVESPTNYKGFGVSRLFKYLLLQFMENLSGRELERHMEDSTSAKWFCDFDLTENTPDHTVFSKMLSKISTERLS